MKSMNILGAYEMPGNKVDMFMMDDFGNAVCFTADMWMAFTYFIIDAQDQT